MTSVFLAFPNANSTFVVGMIRRPQDVVEKEISQKKNINLVENGKTIHPLHTSLDYLG